MTIIQPLSRWQTFTQRDFRPLLARLPLPMLALAASYGVYRYAVLFVPFWVAVIQAAAFELTYIGLASQRDLSDDARKRASYISIGAVVVSIIYNTLAGLFDRNPQWLTEIHWAFEWLLAILHGAPLALVAYLVADLLLHSNNVNLSALVAQLQTTIDELRATITQNDETIAQVTQERDAAIAQNHAHTNQADAERTKATAIINELRAEVTRYKKDNDQLRAQVTHPQPLTFTTLLERARQLQNTGASLREIATELSVPEATLRGWLKKAGE